MGYEYYQQFEIAHLLKGKVIDKVAYMDHEGEVGLLFKFTDKSSLWIEIAAFEDDMMRLTLEVDPKDYTKREHCLLDITGYWGKCRGDWRKEDPGW